MTREVDFDVVREDWSSDKLETGTSVRHKISVNALEFDDEKRQAKPQFKSMYHLIPSKEDQGPPDENFVPGRLTDADVLGQVKFEPLKEPMNIYDVPSEKVLVLTKLFIRQVGRTEKFNKKGFRIFKAILLIAAGTIPYPVPPSLDTKVVSDA